MRSKVPVCKCLVINFYLNLTEDGYKADTIDLLNKSGINDLT